MRVGVPKEVKVHEYRVGLGAGERARAHRARTSGVRADRRRRAHGHRPTTTIAGSAQPSLPTAAEVFDVADMIVKVKEPQAAERAMLRQGQTLFTYLHLAPDPDQAKDLLRSGVTAIAYETVTGARGGLPLLSPMSEVAGRMSIQAGAHCLEMEQGGRGMLLGGSAGVAPANVVVIGGGVSGVNAVRMAIGLEAAVTCIDINIERLYALDQQFGASVNTIFSTRQAIEDYVLQADLVVGAVLVPGAAAPKLITEKLVKAMKRGSVIVDISIDQGGFAETSHADDAHQSDLRDARRRALLRRQHAGRRGAHLDLRAQQRHAAVRAGAGQQGHRGGAAQRPASAGRPQRLRGQDHLSGGGRGAGPAVRRSAVAIGD